MSQSRAGQGRCSCMTPQPVFPVSVCGNAFSRGNPNLAWIQHPLQFTPSLANQIPVIRLPSAHFDLIFSLSHITIIPGTHIIACMMIHLNYKESRPLSLDRVGSRSRRLCESPPTPTESYERRPCMCHILCTYPFLLFVKKDSWWGARSLQRAIKTTPFSGANSLLSQCHAWLVAIQFSAPCQTHIQCTLNWTARGRHAGKERGRMDDGREGARGGWEQGRERGSYDVREAGSGKGGSGPNSRCHQQNNTV